MKHTYKQPFFDLYDAVTLECWLSDLALKGLVFDGIAFGLFRFKKGSPQVVQYRVEPLLKEGAHPSPELCDAYASAGWTFVTSLNRSFSIWCTTDPDAQELHSDPIVQSEGYHRICSQLKRSAIITSLYVLGMFAMVVGGFIVSDWPVILFLSSSTTPILLIMELLLTLQVICSARSAFKLQRMLAEGTPLSHHKKPRKAFFSYYVLQGLSFCLAISVLISSYFTLTTPWRKNVVDLQAPLPFLSLDVIEQTDTFTWAEPRFIRDSTINYNNYVDYAWTPFLPAHYEIFQEGAEEAHMWPDKSGYYHPSAYTDYYALRFGILAPIVFEELMARHLYMPLSEYTIEEIDQFDRTVIATEGYMTHLFVHEGNQVLYIRYHGYADLSERLDLLEAVLVAE